jgi:hypothetical protein
MDTLKMTIPTKIEPTYSRTWLVSVVPVKNDFYTIPLAIVPAFLATILVFMDQQVTAVIANRKELKLKVIVDELEFNFYLFKLFKC